MSMTIISNARAAKLNEEELKAWHELIDNHYTHGEYRTYSRGCICVECKAAKREQNKMERAYLAARSDKTIAADRARLLKKRGLINAKMCRHCGKTEGPKPLGAFADNRTRPDGKQEQCMKCDTNIRVVKRKHLGLGWEEHPAGGLYCGIFRCWDQGQHLGHLISLANGGEDTVFNSGPLCPKHNAAQGSMNMDEYEALSGEKFVIPEAVARNLAKLALKEAIAA
jgi:hypothetical protein